MKKGTVEDFFQKAKKIHGDKYDYSKVKYVNCRTKVCIICPEHGEFWQTPHSHIDGHGCPKCGENVKIQKSSLTLDEYKEGVCKHHPEYDLSLITKYQGRDSIVSPICPIHGVFEINARSLYRGHGCQKCGREKTNKTNSKNQYDFIKQAMLIHGDKYDYSKVEYVNNLTKVCIICPIHGEFWQTPNNHLQGSGCKKCSPKHKRETEEWTQMAKQIHGDKYDYSKVEYVNKDIKVCMVCPKHGEFWVRPNDHLAKKSGCPKCYASHLESKIRNLLMEKNVNFVEQKKFRWLGRQSLDFYLPEQNIAIECQGLQHFESVKHFGGDEGLLKRQILDERKRQLCIKHGITVFYYADYEYDFPYQVYNEKMLMDNIC